MLGSLLRHVSLIDIDRGLGQVTQMLFNHRLDLVPIQTTNACRWRKSLYMEGQFLRMDSASP